MFFGDGLFVGCYVVPQSFTHRSRSLAMTTSLALVICVSLSVNETQQKRRLESGFFLVKAIAVPKKTRPITINGPLEAHEHRDTQREDVTLLELLVDDLRRHVRLRSDHL